MRTQLVIGHRGASSEAPENTMKSFRIAWEIGADMVELDVQETADGHIICMHDYDVSRTTTGTGMVSELDLEEIQSFDAGENERVPLLSEVLDFALNRIMLNIEVKAFDVEQKILDLVNSRRMQDQVIYSSFFYETLQNIAEIQSDATTAVLLNEPIDDTIEYVLDLGAKAVNPQFRIIDANFVRAAHEQGLKVYPWTVNDESAMVDLLQMEVDGMITDQPRLCISVISKHMK